MDFSNHNKVSARSLSKPQESVGSKVFIGNFSLPGRALLAPMAGVSDYPFRKVCLAMGAAMATAEMSASNPILRNSLKSQLRLPHREDREPRAVQIVGSDPEQLAAAARYQVSAGAQIVDINMGCPAKKVCNKLAGSALLGDEKLVEDILQAVVKSVEVPVTLKIRTGSTPEQKNAVTIAKIAEQAGIQALAVHGRTRACKFRGAVEYDTIAKVVDAIGIPVFANGDINSAHHAAFVLKKTGAAAVMIGRAAQGRPWIFSEINHLLNDSHVFCGLLPDKSLNLVGSRVLERLIIDHLRDIHQFYDHAVAMQNVVTRSKRVKNRNSGNFLTKLSVKVARKHICWYFEQLEHMRVDRNKSQEACLVSAREKNSGISVFSQTGSTDDGLDVFSSARTLFNKLQQQDEQLDFIQQLFEDLRQTGVIAA